MIDPHSIDNFIKEHDKKTLQDVADSQMDQLFLRNDANSAFPRNDKAPQQTPQQPQEG